MKRLVSILLGLVLGFALVIPMGASAQAAPYCGISWGSLAKAQSPGSSLTSITGVRAGEHSCYDRMVIDVHGDVRGYSVRYVDQVYAEGSGARVPLRGGAKLEVVAHAPTYDPVTGRSTYTPSNRKELRNVSGYSTFRQIASGGSFEGQTTIGLGVRARLPFRVFVLDGPGSGSRLVIDVAHRW
ncbi:hypothetical protein M3148_10455 [Georgenia satyanarayanai]|uniref:AMIN-like domain-containing (lipo)protein n=1 Tax=Georgenia satyanarayanai TaxID=860221 RepID=UPI002040CB47|nr:hypothetical protein [Georgenia satyanarayanai]MCM3661403.1 hypothetical protein [Georgenia satyanarayanai]